MADHLSLVECIKTIALRDVLLETSDYRIREICRWYSREFSTPLPTVEADVPLLILLQHYFENQFSNMTAEEIDEEKMSMLETDEGRRLRMRREDADAAGAEEIHSMLEQEAARMTAARAKNPNQQLVEINPANPVMFTPETRLPDSLPKDLPQDIQMTFVTEEEMERRLESFGRIPIPKKDDQ